MDSLKHLQSEDASHYQHHDSMDDFYEAMAEVVLEDLHSSIQSSPYQYYGIEIDEGTDNSNKSIMIAFIRFVNKDGVLQTRFLGVKELHMTDANTIFRSTRHILDEHNLPVQQMFGLATDGASVMTGIHKGVATQ